MKIHTSMEIRIAVVMMSMAACTGRLVPVSAEGAALVEDALEQKVEFSQVRCQSYKPYRSRCYIHIGRVDIVAVHVPLVTSLLLS